MNTTTPFTTIFGKEPIIYINRDDLLENLLVNLNNPFSDAQSTIITGVRGSGKTTFLTKIHNSLDDDWIKINLLNNGTIIEEFIATLAQKVQNEISLGASLSFKQFSVFGLTMVSNDMEATQRQKLEELLNLCKKANRKVILFIDELTNTPEIQQLYSLFQLFIRNDLPLTIVSAGLPEEVNEVITDKILTFLMRSRHVNLTPLTENSIAEIYKEELELDYKTAYQAAQLTKGYAYAFQLLGNLLYQNHIHKFEDFDTIIEDYRLLLFKNAYQLIANRLTKNDIIFLKTIHDSVRIATIIEEIGWSKAQVNNYRIKLIEKGLINQESRGLISLSLPEFDVFLEEFFD